MNWNRVIDCLPVIPDGKYGVSVILATFDPCYDEINSGHGYSINQYASYSDHGEGLEFYELCGEDWIIVCDIPTHWMYLPKPPEYDPEVLNPIFQRYHETAIPQSPLKQI